MTIEDDIAFFERVPTLSVLGRAALRILAIGAESRYVHAGEVLFYAGDDADSAYVIQEGSFALLPERAEGEAREVVAGRGTLLGEVAMITPIKARSKAVMSPARALENMRTAASGMSVTIPAKIISEMPLPIPRSVICSPSHMMNAVPVVRVRIVMNRKNQPGA